MQCPECENAEMVGVIAPTHRVRELPSAHYFNVEIRTCPKCGAVVEAIPAILQQHRRIAKALAEKARSLAPDEIKFLRKYLGWSAHWFDVVLDLSSPMCEDVEAGYARLDDTAEQRLRRKVLETVDA